MEKVMLKECHLDINQLKNVVSIGVFGSYHEECFDEKRSDIDIIVLLEKELEYEEEFEIEDYLETVLPEYFNHNNIHYTFISGFNYPFSELLLISNDKLIFKEEKYLDYILGYSAFKRDREPLEIMRNENLKELEAIKNGLL